MRLRSAKRRQAAAAQGRELEYVPSSANAGVDLPPELMYILANALSVEDVAAASMACVSWAKLLRAGITRATLLVGGDDGPQPVAAMRSLGAHSAVSTLQLLLSSRSGYQHVHGVLSGLSTLPQLANLVLTFMVSPTAKKGSWPIFFADELDAQQLASLTLQGPAMPAIALVNLLFSLCGQNGSPPASGLTHLALNLGRGQPGSQLPPYASPSWLVGDTSSHVTGLRLDTMKLLAQLTSLRSLAMEALPDEPPKSLKQLSHLTNLTELVLHGATLQDQALQQLPQLRSLRRLSLGLCVSPRSWPAQLDVLRDLTHLQQLDLNLVPHPLLMTIDGVVQSLAAHPPPALRALRADGVWLRAPEVERLGGLTGLTSLQLLRAEVECGPMLGTHLNLTPLSQLTGLRQFALQLHQADERLRLMLLAPPPPPKPERMLTGACQSVGKRQKRATHPKAPPQPQKQQQQLQEHDVVAFSNVDPLLAAWPQLEALTLAGLPPLAVSNCRWARLASLTALTSLVLQFVPHSSRAAAFCEEAPGLKQPPHGPGGGLPLLRLELLPPRLAELQLTHAFVCLPADERMRLGEGLTSLSLSRCCLATTAPTAPAPSSGSGSSRGRAAAASSSSAGGRSNVGIICDTGGAAAGASPPPRGHPLLLLLGCLPRLAQLELINLPWLRDELLAAAAAVPALRGLATLSVLGVGNQAVTHGGLLGLTGLRKLRTLRWHVGDALELMPDVGGLAQLRGLVALHVPTWLHAQMERWGAYAVLDSLPLCDVHVEVPA